MTDEDYKDLVTDHDKSIGIMATSIEHLASAVGSTNGKLDDIIEVLGTQNILAEKFTNLEANLKESFGRVHTKVATIEEEAHNAISPTALRWALGIVVVYMVSFGTYVVQELHSLDTITATHIAESALIDTAQSNQIAENAELGKEYNKNLNAYFRMETEEH